MATTIIKAAGGNRAKNLTGIARQIATLMDIGTLRGRDGDAHLTQQEVHRLNGYAEQLRIIAGELPAHS